MKISQLNGDEMLDALADLTPIIAEMSDDIEFIKLFRYSPRIPEGIPDEQKEKLRNKNTKKKITQFIKVLLKDNKEKVWEILSAVGRKNVDEYRNMNGLSLMGELTELFLDKDTLDFFTQLFKLAKADC